MLPKLNLPDNLNYIGTFLTMGCNLNCGYCINIPNSKQELTNRDSIFPIKTVRSHLGMKPEQWILALNRIPKKEGLPITLQGGEPTIYYGGKGVEQIFDGVDHHFDLLTNMASLSFYQRLIGLQHKLKRKAPYPSIRVSWHKDEMDRLWNNKGFEELVKRCLALEAFGFKVSPDKSESDVGIYMVDHPSNELPEESIWKGKVPFEVKEFLGVHEGELYGTYRYKHSTDLISNNLYHKTLDCECRTTELLLDEFGFVWNCHFHLYETNAKEKETLSIMFNMLSRRNFRYKLLLQFEKPRLIRKPIGHILDPEFSMEDLKEFRQCYDYGKCVGCDTKIKNNNKQSLDNDNIPHTSVEIKNIKWPKELL